MDGTQVLTLGLQAPWILKDQHLDRSVSPHRLDLYVETERGSLYPCPECGKACPAHDFADKAWRHLNFFQHHCYLHARVPRTKCPEHGVKRIEVSWARPGSDFVLLFEQAAHGGDPYNVVEVACDMSQAFLGGVAEHLSRAEVTVDWFHIVQTFTKRLDVVCKKECREQGHPKSLRWALLKSLDNENLTPKQLAALQELVADQSATADAWVIKEKLRWIQKAPTPRAARWRITNYLKVMKAAVSEKPLLKPMGKALERWSRMPMRWSGAGSRD